MIKLFSLKSQQNQNQMPNQRRNTAAQIRITKGLFYLSPISSLIIINHQSIADINELTLPKNGTIDFGPDNDLLNFKISLCPDEVCIYGWLWFYD